MTARAKLREPGLPARPSPATSPPIDVIKVAANAKMSVSSPET